MEWDCCSTMSRLILFVTGWVFLVCAAVLSTMSIYIFITYNHMDQFLQSQFLMLPAALLLTVGVVLVIASFVGFMSAASGDNKTMICVIGTFLLLAVVLLIVVSGSVVAFRLEVDDNVRNRTQRLLNHYGAKDHKFDTEQVDFVQKEMKCCGVANYTDWADTPFGMTYFDKVPKSCCKVEFKANCTGSTHEVDMLYKEGCYVKVRDYFMAILLFVIISSVILITSLVVGFLCAVFAMCCRRSENVPYLHLET